VAAVLTIQICKGGDPRTLPRLTAALLCCALAAPLAVQAADDASRAAVLLDHGFDVHANQTYVSVSGRDLKLDVYAPSTPPQQRAAVPVVLNLHGGGWVFGSREGASLTALPYMQMGFAVVNAEYRLAKSALAPAAVEDALCALQWIDRNARKYNFGQRSSASGAIRISATGKLIARPPTIEATANSSV
jgi:acetyl esterase/lipase